MTVYEFPELTEEAAHYWLKMDAWKPYDAAWLLCGMDPHGMEQRYGAFATELCTQMCGDHPASKAAFQIVELLKASSQAGSISFPAAPSAVIAWAKTKGLELPSRFHGVQFDGTEQATPATGGAGETASANRTEARIAAIVETAQQLGYDPLSVPYGGKAAIRRECLDKLAADPCRFTSDTFKSAWQAARDAQQIDVQNAETYRGQ
ncbi:MAG: hypothetical protein HZA63_05160 [Rhodocyclales bacterium]|nr:hypothetical protein [Rhodocyclales bacterium]